jgi:hypothetical protein
MNAKETLKEIRTMLGFSDEPVAVELATATLTDGTVITYEGELAIGTAIFVQTAEGDIPAPDATHEVEGGLLVTTVGGLVTEIVEPVEEVALEEVAVEVPAEVSQIVTGEVLEAIAEALAPVLEEVQIIKEEMKKMRKTFSMTVDLVEKVADLPSEEPTKTPVSNKKNDQFEALKRLKNSLNK